MENGVKYDGGKPRYDLIDPRVLEGLAKVLTMGSVKYDDDNWKKVEDGGDRYYSAMLRHIEARRMGQKYDEETGLPHSIHAMANAMFLAYFDITEEEIMASESFKIRLWDGKVEYRREDDWITRFESGLDIAVNVEAIDALNSRFARLFPESEVLLGGVVSKGRYFREFVVTSLTINNIVLPQEDIVQIVNRDFGFKSLLVKC